MSLYLFLILILQIIIINSNNTTSENSTKALNKTKLQEKKKIDYEGIFNNSTLKSLTDKTFEPTLLNNQDHDYVIFFTVKRCQSCLKVMNLLEKIQEQYANKTSTSNKKIEFVKIDCFQSKWTCTRFYFNRIPNIIYVSNWRFSTFSAKEHFTNETIQKFIDSTDKIYKLIPQEVGYISIVLKIMKSIDESLGKSIPYWNYGLKYLVYGGLIVLFFFWQKRKFSPKAKDGKKDNDKDKNKKDKKKIYKKHDNCDSDDENGHKFKRKKD